MKRDLSDVLDIYPRTLPITEFGLRYRREFGKNLGSCVKCGSKEHPILRQQDGKNNKFEVWCLKCYFDW
jgi:hypothetical protein